MTRVATKPGEARLWASAVKVTGRYGIGEASPPSVGLLEAVLPDALDVLVVRLGELK